MNPRAALGVTILCIAMAGCSAGRNSGPLAADPQPSPTGASVKAPPVDEHAALRVNAGASACLDLPNVSAVIEWLPPLTRVEGGAVPLIPPLTAALKCDYSASGGQFVSVQYFEGSGQGDSCKGFFVGTSGAPPDSNGGYFMDKYGNHEQSDYGICGVDVQLGVTIYRSDVPRPDAAAMGAAAAALWEHRTALHEVASGPAVAP